MNARTIYEESLREIPTREVRFGCGGIKLFDSQTLPTAQIGFAATPDGRSLCTGAAGAWRESWLVIGIETLVGDPIFVDSSDPVLPVFTAMHGEGAWNPSLIAPTLQAFLRIYSELSRMSDGRTSPVELESNPLSPSEHEAFVRLIADLGANDSGFWESQLES